MTNKVFFDFNQIHTLIVIFENICCLKLKFSIKINLYENYMLIDHPKNILYNEREIYLINNFSLHNFQNELLKTNE